MKLRNFFYLLLALPLFFAGCTESGTDEPVKKEATLELTSEATLTFDAEGGSGAIAYTLTNAAEGVNVTATCEADWVSDLTVGNYVTFNVAANEGDARSTKVVVAYQEKSFEVTVNQAAYEAPAPEYYMEDRYTSAMRVSLAEYGYPYNYFYLGFINQSNTAVLSGILVGAEGENVLSAGTYTTANEGAFVDTFSIAFASGNDLLFEGGDATIVVEGDIEGYAIDFLLTDAEGKLYHFTFEGVIENMDPFASLPTGPVNFTAQILEGEYYGTDWSVAPNYYISLSDIGCDEEGYALPGGTYYNLDLYSVAAEVDAEGYITIPAGTYVFDAEDTTEAWTMGNYYSYYAKINEAGTAYEVNCGFESGQVVVTADSITLTVMIMGAEHTVVYNGAPKLYVGGGSDDASVEFAAEYAWAVYFGDQYTPGYADNFYFFLSDLGLDADGYELPNATYYRFDLYSPLCDGTAIPAGTYTIDMYDSGNPWTISLSYSAYYVMDEAGWDWAANDYPTEGTVVVGEDGSVTGTITLLMSGETHQLTFNGEIAVTDMSSGGEGGGSDEIYSTLTEDWYCNLSDHVVVTENYGDWYEVGCDNWMVMIKPSTGVGDYILLDLLSGDGDLFGTYTVSDSYAQGTGVPGYFDAWGYLAGCWYYRSEDAENISSYAPMVDGWIDIVNNEDGTITVEFDVWDDADYNITGKWTGAWSAEAGVYKASKKTSKTTKSVVVANNAKSKEDYRVVAPVKKSANNVAPNKGLKLR